ncbi:MAG: hypothetical protein WAL63_02835 [Solirubrobacteraceae bacterium]
MARTASLTAFSAGLAGSGMTETIASVDMQIPRLLLWTQVLIVVFVLAGIVIAITRLA